MAIQSYSVQFNGSTQYLSTPRILDSSGDLTIEAWVYITATPSANGAFILGQYVGAGADRTIFNVDSTLKVGFQAGAVSMGSTTTLVLNRWYHVAVTRIGSGANNMALYVNGTKEGQMTYTGTFQNTNTTIGFTPNLVNTWLTGYISNLRIVKGTAVYTANFTTPVSPLIAVANTALLTCNSSTIVDNSGNNVTITLNGSPVAGTFVPFFTTGIAFRNTIPAAYSVTFNGTTDYLSLTYSSALNLTGTYTIEGWVKITSTSSLVRYLFQMSATTAANFAIIGIYLLNGIITVETRPTTGGALATFTGATTLSTNTWYHIAVSNNANSCKLFINGVQDGSGTISTMAFTPSFVAIGRLTNGFTTNQGYHAGSISNFRIVTGTSLYNSNFTPPNTPLGAISGTQLLTCAATTIKDNSTNNYTISTTGTPTVSTDNAFGILYSNRLKFINTLAKPYSVQFNGTNKYLRLTDNLAAFNFGTGDFTEECWFYTTQVASQVSVNSMFVGGVSVGSGFTIRTQLGGSIAWTSGNTDVYQTPISINTWYHVAYSRQSGTGRFFVNGIKQSESADTLNYSSNSWNVIGTWINSGIMYFTGNISNFRVVKGTAVYTANFTPPSTKLTAIANTSLLTCNEPTIIDTSTNNFTITNNGGATVSSTLIPFLSDTATRLKIYSVT